MTTPLACLAAVIGYWAWQRSRYEGRLPPAAAQAHAVADAAAMALVIALLWVGGSLAPRWGVVAARGLPGATIGAVIGIILADPLRRALLRGYGSARTPARLHDVNAGRDARTGKGELPPGRG